MNPHTLTPNALASFRLNDGTSAVGGAFRIFVAILIGGVVTFALFVLMHNLTQSDAKPSILSPMVALESIVFEKEEPEIKNEKKLPKPPKVLQQPELKRDPIPTDAKPHTGFGDPITVDIPSDEYKTNLNNFKMQGEARPLVRFPPDYPPVASREGIEGWVEMSFSIDTSGAVTNVEVTNSEPKRIFDRAARRALQRWKYQAKVVNGKAIEQHGLSVMLEFKLSE
ncbi:MAG: energy transducer TonB [Glaciecola sp.]